MTGWKYGKNPSAILALALEFPNRGKTILYSLENECTIEWMFLNTSSNDLHFFKKCQTFKTHIWAKIGHYNPVSYLATLSKWKRSSMLYITLDKCRSFSDSCEKHVYQFSGTWEGYIGVRQHRFHISIFFILIHTMLEYLFPLSRSQPICAISRKLQYDISKSRQLCL